MKTLILFFLTSRSNITIAFYKNDQRTPISLAYRPVSKSLIYTINLAALIDFDKWDIVELKIFSNQSTSMTIFAGSSFSVIQLGNIADLSS